MIVFIKICGKLLYKGWRGFHGENERGEWDLVFPSEAASGPCLKSDGFSLL